MSAITLLLKSLWKLPEGQRAIAIATIAAATLCIAVGSLFASDQWKSKRINDLERERRIEDVRRERECDSVTRAVERRCDSIRTAGDYAEIAELKAEIAELRKDYKDAVNSTSQATKAQVRALNRIKKATKEVQK